MSNPLARLLGSLANVVLDFGLPTIRGWLRERLGPDADVADVKTDGTTVTLLGVRIPLGSRGLVVLDRATATITSLGDDGPALRLHSFEGVLVFTKPELRDAFARTDDTQAYVANATFRADLSFSAGDAPDPAAWIWGDLEIPRALWTTESPGAPLTGRARLFVSSREWRLEGGRLDGAESTTADGKPPVVARFAAAGMLERADDEDAETTLVPSTLVSLAFALENGRVGPFLDALTALVGAEVVRARVPAAIPRDTRLDGELSWSAAVGARAELRLDAATIGARATVRLGFASDGSALDARVDGTLVAAPLLRRLDLPSVAIPREEDVIALVMTATGHVRAPEAQLDLTAPQLGFRLGRPRFVPAVVLRDFSGSVFFKGDRAVGRITGDAHGPVAIDIDAGRADTRIALSANDLGATLLRDIAATMNQRVTIMDDAQLAIALVHTREGLDGKVTLRTSRSNLELALSKPMRLTGGVALEDVLATGLVENGALYPTRGNVVVGLELDGLAARGQLAASEIELRVGHRELRYVVSGVSTEVAVSAAGLRYENLAFSGYRGRFRGEGDVSFAPRETGSRLADAPAAPYLTLTLEEGGAELARELLLLVPEPRPDLTVPDSLRAAGKLVLTERLVIYLSLTTSAGSQLGVEVRSQDGDLHGSTARGTVALVDALQVAGSRLPVDGLLTVDLDMRERVIRGVIRSAQVTHAPFSLTELSADILVEPSGDIFWNRLDGRIAGGRVSSFGLLRQNGDVLARLSAAAVAVQELPSMEGREPGKYVRGRASGSVVVHRAAAGVIDARGDVVLDEAAFPVIDRARPALQRYGLRPPNEDATGPAVATLVMTPRGLEVTDIAVDLHGANVRGRVAVGATRALDGLVEIVLAEEYLRTSKVLTLPRVLGDRLVIPIRLAGTTDAPDVQAELGQTLGQFLRDTKVGDFITSAVEEAQLFFTSNKRRTMTPPAIEPAAPAEVDWETPLRRAIDARAADWAALAARR